MGYTTEFQGRFELDKPLTKDQFEYLKKFADVRHMRRDISKLKLNLLMEKVNLPLGIEGEYFIDGLGSYGQGQDSSIMDYNNPPSTQPGLWCQWEPDEDMQAIVWNEAEKFYNYIEWLIYMVENFIAPWGLVLSGDVRWRGEEFDDTGIIQVRNNVVITTMR